MENQNTEYKTLWKDEFLKEICAFANAQGGTLYIGIDDKGNAVGVTDVRKLLETLPNKVRDTLGIVVEVSHKQYTGAPIQMRIFEDHIELWNEGNLPEDYTIETLMHKHASKPRNLNIAEVFNKAGFIEAWGRGYKKIYDGFAASNLPMPVFRTAFGGVEVIIQRRKITENVGVNGGINKQQLTNRQRNILTIIKESGGISGGIKEGLTKEELAKLLGVGLRTVEREMSILKQLNLVEHLGSNKTGYWIVKVE